MKNWLGVACVTVALGCSSADNDKGTSAPVQNGPCGTRTGIWKLTWTERAGGTCGPVKEHLSDFSAPPDGTCNSSGIRESADKCSTEGTITCGTIRAVTTCKWGSDNRSGACVTSVTDSASPACSSTYDIRYAKQ